MGNNKRPDYRTLTVPLAVFAVLERWRTGIVDRGVDSLPLAMRAPMRAALVRVDGKHKGVVGLGVVLGALFDTALASIDPDEHERLITTRGAVPDGDIDLEVRPGPTPRPDAPPRPSRPPAPERDDVHGNDRDGHGDDR